MRKKIFLASLAVVLIVLTVWALWANVAVESNTVTVTNEKLPEEFDGFRIAHVSDLHSASFYMDVIALLDREDPDIICITGDLMDSRDSSVDNALDFCAEAVRIAPCYYVTGNHEPRLQGDLYTQLLMGLEELGVHVLDDREVLLEREGNTISLTGHFWGDTDTVGELSNHDGYRILLSHQPEDFANYAAGGYDLVLSGHTHGGQFRLPFIGGVYAYGQGFFPEYDAGLFHMDGTDMIVSRGIGNSTVPLRIGNRPEVVLIILKNG